MIKDYLDYNPKTGLFTWIKQPSKRIFIGDTAGGIYRATYFHRYIKISFKGNQYYAHRLAYLFIEGSLPGSPVYHINNNLIDNRWENLTTDKTKCKHKGLIWRY